MKKQIVGVIILELMFRFYGPTPELASKAGKLLDIEE